VQKKRETGFYNDMLKGNVYKDMVKLLLEKSGYIVYPYGYESAFSHVRSMLTKDTRSSRTVRRIRSSPDLLVFDKDRNDLMLVEVKMRTKVPPEIKPRLVENLKEFWSDSFLALVVPESNVFYVQKISELETRRRFYRLADLEKFQDVFARISEEDLSHFKDKALRSLEEHKRQRIQKS